MRIVMVGGEGHASEIFGALEALWRLAISGENKDVIGIVADSPIDTRRFLGRGLRQIGALSDLPSLGATHFIAAVGYPLGRKKVSDIARAAGLTPYTVIHPEAWVPEGTPIGEGSVILARACIGVGVRIGDLAAIGATAVIGHDCLVGDYASVMPGAAVSGDTLLDEGAMIGANATILEKRRLGAWSIVGAGAVVTKNIPAGVVVTGIPAEIVTSPA